MLVVSRKRNQNILFPNLGIVVEILRVAGNSVSVGIKAPSSVRVLRGELANRESDQPETVPLPHTLRNQLHKANLAVALAQKQLRSGKIEDAEKTLDAMIERLRCFDADLLPQDAYAAIATGSSHAESSESARRALVVEDDANERVLLAGYLRLCGMTVFEAADGVEALELLQSVSVDLIVLDMHMPRMNGAETLRSVRRMAKLRRTRVIVVSGERADDAEYADVQPNVSDWFAKPFNPAQLVECLQTAER